ncbi:FAD-dependent oxidoreductase [Pseudonocardia sp. DSM 110487]|uniref:FAD-dependent oxidoreductase n=1 Tax=Pseudonocardia sp. DSM 110487 TaxID=2865833 RepID=UPI001C69E502|nr:FAD-dependent oxidoreductase [Pseudonocardia sp. DSM 110487]QYN38977.1 FAD-dependent oxidoreductase [Pseudonocardia sp. DSM 110487]
MTKHYDVIVAGGGSAGIGAAIGARRTGARTLLIERGPCLGGAATLRNVVTYCGLYTRDEAEQVVFGVAKEMLAGLRALDAVSEPTRFTAVAVVFDPEAVKHVADELCHGAGVDVLLHSHLMAATRSQDRIASVRVADHSGIHDYTADAFVDATGEADLGHHGGADVRYGNDGWVQNGTLGIRFGGIPADVSREAIRAAVAAAKAAGARGLTAASGLVARMPVSGDLITYLADEGYDARSAADLSRAERSARRQAHAYLEVIKAIPGCADAYIVSTGPEIGTRESRHLVGRAQLLEKDVLEPGPLGDAVAVGAWPIEYHPGPGIPSEWKFIGAPGYYGIPLDVLHSRDTPNLFGAGRTVDGDRGAGASLRVMGTAFATGQAAGVAAAVVARDADVDVAAVRRELDRQGAWLPGGGGVAG